MKIHSYLCVNHQSYDNHSVNEALDARDVFPLSMLFGYCLMDEDIRVAAKDLDFMVKAVQLMKRVAKEHIEKRTAAGIENDYENVDTMLFGGEEDRGSKKAMEHAEKALFQGYTEMRLEIEEELGGKLD